ncbi:integral peroxisomal membrane peroxin-domain-containing protein [Xylaria bambusicola]|uniref:integral peroxisomal membrane peroxin-domain-containing protein n=1 Tax=Xylaria bambusicola TaxID=326684 RepID=UPI0020088CCA|nr:integral peroxisomal membrane peroxin-domain-containing protein [Xylaria bambusicola]KAI0517916.1 integral peroxisomal membrane peroxin-domain-containing protein [Xylaria bambusicola]
MAALDIPWMTHMSTPRSTTPRADIDVDSVANPSGPATPAAASSTSAPSFNSPSYAPPTYASFSPTNLSSTAAAAKRTSTILVHQKSPLLLATPPQITRALAYSHPFLLPLNKLAGLLTWTTGDPWESFLLLVVYWVVVQYGDNIVRFAGPIVTVFGIIAGMYARRYSPLSSSGWAEHPSLANSKDKKKGNNASSSGSQPGQGHQRNASEVTTTRHQKTLDEIVDTLRVFTSRCNILLEPLLEMTDFLSTQRTATSATTRPALTTLFVRILAVTPIWILLTLPPLRIITTKRVVFVFGTLVLSWHSKVCRVTRTLLWRSATIRKVAQWITGLEFERPVRLEQKENLNGHAVDGKTKPKRAHEAAKISSSALTEALKRSRLGAKDKDSGVRFTFILYENQRRWLGLGWTNSLFAYERAAWTDEQNNPVPPKDEFELPEVEDGRAKWRWVEGTKWRVDGVPDLDEGDYDGEGGRMGWIFYDNKWQNGRRGVDGWGRWTRRRKWYRDAELVEVSEDELPSPSPPPPALPARPQPTISSVPDTTDASAALSVSPPEATNSEDKSKGEDDAASLLSTSSKSARFRFSTPSLRRRTTSGTQHSRRTSEVASVRSNEDDSTLDPALELEIHGHQRDLGQWGIGDDAQMGLE